VFPEPYWGYEDIGIFFVFLVLLTPILHHRRRDLETRASSELLNCRSRSELCESARLASAVGMTGRWDSCEINAGVMTNVK